MLHLQLFRFYPGHGRCHPRRSAEPALRLSKGPLHFPAPKNWGPLSDEPGSAILEFAISLPLLVIFVVGIYDFSGAFNQKQKIELAAQEGAIIAGSQPMNDIATSNPDSLQPVVFAVFNSLTASGVLRGTCTAPGSVTGPATNLSFTYKITGCPDELDIVIRRGLVLGTGTSTDPASVATQVVVKYPYHWQFNSVIQLMVPGATYAAITELSESATVHNQI